MRQSDVISPTAFPILLLPLSSITNFAFTSLNDYDTIPPDQFAPWHVYFAQHLRLSRIRLYGDQREAQMACFI